MFYVILFLHANGSASIVIMMIIVITFITTLILKVSITS